VKKGQCLFNKVHFSQPLSSFGLVGIYNQNPIH